MENAWGIRRGGTDSPNPNAGAGPSNRFGHRPRHRSPGRQRWTQRTHPGQASLGTAGGAPSRFRLLVEHDVLRKPVPIFRHHALVSRFRSSPEFAARSEANFGIEGTSNSMIPVSL